MPINNAALTAETYETTEIQTQPENTQAELNIFAFLPENVEKHIDEIITIDAPPGFDNKDGTRAKMQLRKLTYDQIEDITKKYRKRRIVTTKKGRVVTDDKGRPVYEDNTDNKGLTNALIAESLVYPDLNDQTLCRKYGTGQPAEIVAKMFASQEAFLYMSRAVAEHVLGVGDDDIVDEAKN